MCIITNEEAKLDFVKKISEFKKNPTYDRYQHEVKFGPDGIYTLFIWSPTETYDCGPLYCEEHGTELTLGPLTDYISVGNRKTNPR